MHFSKKAHSDFLVLIQQVYGLISEEQVRNGV